MGVAKTLKESRPNVKIFAVWPPAGYKIQGIQHQDLDFCGSLYDQTLVDEVVEVAVEDAYEKAREIGRVEGLTIGMSAGAALAGVVKKAPDLGSGNAVVLLADRGEKYLSTELFNQK